MIDALLGSLDTLIAGGAGGVGGGTALLISGWLIDKFTDD